MDDSTASSETPEAIPAYLWNGAPEGFKTEAQLRDEDGLTPGPIRAILLHDPPVPLYDVSEATEVHSQS